MKKVKSISKLKEEAWGWFSKHIRLRDCLLTTGRKDRGRCFTCDKVFPFNELQAGHFLDGRTKAILFDERIVHAQCRGCNLFKSGNKDEYTPRMIKKYGMSEVEKMWQKKKESLKGEHWSREELEAIKKEYKEIYEVEFKNN